MITIISYIMFGYVVDNYDIFRFNNNQRLSFVIMLVFSIVTDLLFFRIIKVSF